MRLDQEVGFALGVLLLMQLLTAFAAIALFNRMGPAVDEILRENVSSQEAASDMLAILAGPAPEQRSEAFGEALDRARESITDRREQALVDAVAVRSQAALQGDLRATIEVVDALRQLAAVNRGLMQTANQVAVQRWKAGAWTAVVLGVTTFLVGTTVYRRMRGRIELPVLEVDETLVAARGGDVLRRCAPLGGPRELRRIAQNVNWMLDRWMLQGEHVGEDRLRAALLHLMDHYPTPVLLVDPAEGILAMNRHALELLDREERPANLLERLREGGALEGWTVDRVPDTEVRLLTRER